MATKDVLSEGEIDALMDSVSSVPVSVPDNGEARSFDFSTREQAMLAQMPALQMINEQHALALMQFVQEIFKVSAVVEAKDVQLLKLEEALVSIEDLAAFNVINVTPLSGVSLVIIPGDLLSFFVNYFFGGSGNSATEKHSRTKLTPAEERINNALRDKFLIALVDSWKEKITLNTELVSLETNPDLLQVGAKDDLVLQFIFTVKIQDWESSVVWVIPYAALEPLRPRLDGSVAKNSMQKSATNWDGHFRKELLSVDVDVSGIFASSNVSLADVLGFKPGSIVPLKLPTEVTVCIEGEPFFLGEHGENNRKKSIKITEIF